MEMLDLIMARTGISISIAKIRNSVDEIKKTHSHKKELIESMEKTVSDLTFSYCTFCDLEMEYRAARQRANDLEINKFGDMDKLKLIIEQNKKLMEQNEDLKIGI